MGLDVMNAGDSNGWTIPFWSAITVLLKLLAEKTNGVVKVAA